MCGDSGHSCGLQAHPPTHTTHKQHRDHSSTRQVCGSALGKSTCADAALHTAQFACAAVLARLDPMRQTSSIPKAACLPACLPQQHTAALPPAHTPPHTCRLRSAPTASQSAHVAPYTLGSRSSGLHPTVFSPASTFEPSCTNRGRSSTPSSCRQVLQLPAHSNALLLLLPPAARAAGAAVAAGAALPSETAPGTPWPPLPLLPAAPATLLPPCAVRTTVVLLLQRLQESCRVAVTTSTTPTLSNLSPSSVTAHPPGPPPLPALLLPWPPPCSCNSS